jgi:superfamily II DNA or RNA helicase
MHGEPDVAAGPEVIIRGQRWHVLSRTRYEDCTALWLSGKEGANSGVHRTLLLPFDIVEERPAARMISVAASRRWWRHLHRHLWNQLPFAGLETLTGAGIDLHPYQIEPAIALHRHGQLRILIADDVGLGKTIQAAAALAQLARDEPDTRALVVCPAGLREQWRVELVQRFGLRGVVCDPDWLLDASRDLPPRVNPWSLPGIFITSIDLVKRPEVLRALEDVTWDLAIFDEVHACTPGTARLSAARALAERSRRIVLLTATPPDGDPEQLAALLSLGAPAGGAPALVFRRTRADVGLGRIRRSSLLAINLSAEEVAMHRLLQGYALQVWAEGTNRGDRRACLLSTLLTKRALSSAFALALSIERRLALLGGSAPIERQLVLPLLDEDAIEDAPPDAVVGARGLADQDHERSLLEELRQSALRAANAESKVRVLARFLARAGEPAIVFTEYRDTLGRIASLLPQARLQLHGAMLPGEREAVQAAFAKAGGLLLATDAASEGLNLHHGCRLVLHYELPWNPVRLEQRVGRVDRLGQQRRVHEVMLVARHTAERLVLAPLVRRLRAAQGRGGERRECLSESDVAAAILEGRAIAPVLSSPPLADAPSESLRRAAVSEANRLRGCRRLRTTGGAVPPRGTLLTASGPVDTMTAVLRVTATTAPGRQLASVLVPFRVDFATKIVLSPAAALPLVADVESQAALLVRDAWSGGSAWDGWTHVLAALITREHDLRAVRSSPSRELVQAGLFDRRAEASAQARHQAAAAWREQADARVALLSEHRDVRITVEVVAIRGGKLDLP